MAMPDYQWYSKYNARMLAAEEVKKGSIKPDGTEVRIYKHKNEPQNSVSIKKKLNSCLLFSKVDIFSI